MGGVISRNYNIPIFLIRLFLLKSGITAISLTVLKWYLANTENTDAEWIKSMDVYIPILADCLVVIW